MKTKSAKRLAALIAALTICFSVTTQSASSSDINSATNDTAEYVLETVKTPQVGSIGGEWAVLGLARSDRTIPQRYYDDYYNAVVKYVKACNGVLHEKKHTEYSRVVLAMTAIGRDPTNIGGYNLLTALGDFEKTVWQGTNGAVWALIALDSGNYKMPINPSASVQATRDMYIAEILSHQLTSGGFSLTETGTVDTDITAMAVSALSKYQDRVDVKAATDKALIFLSKVQESDGGFSSGGSSNSESAAQVIIALCELNIPVDDSRFVKNGNTVEDGLLTFYANDGGFVHVAGGSGSNQMATEQVLLALDALHRAESGKASLYRMTDVVKHEDTTASAYLPNKHADVKARPIVSPCLTFNDTSGHENRAAIDALASRGIINGNGNGLFEPNATMTRAEFAAIVVRALGLTPKENVKFSDVAPGIWYAPYVGAANTYGIVNGTSDTTYNPNGTITRQESATMVARAAKLCGMDTELDSTAVRNILAQFGDYTDVESWAQPSLAFCYKTDILDTDDMNICPTSSILRCEIAQMLFNILDSARLL
ncbi:MAG: S-layer homology domain-containing protein [Oscillospiraceae bacterium]|nr:S-layer homology domain-containing protein [Oscillospiraceae bacterium]